MERTRIARILLTLARFGLGGVFIVAAVDKIAVPEVFAISIEAYQILPLPLVNLFALIIPWIELLCGVLLIAGVRLRACALLTAFLLVVFEFAIFAAMVRGLKIDCGCFGAQYASPVGWNKIGEDAGLLLLALVVYFASGEKRVDAPPGQRPA